MDAQEANLLSLFSDGLELTLELADETRLSANNFQGPIYLPLPPSVLELRTLATAPAFTWGLGV